MDRLNLEKIPFASTSNEAGNQQQSSPPLRRPPLLQRHSDTNQEDHISSGATR